MTSVLLEAKPYRPFKSSEEYLEAMKEDLAEWLNMMYPELNINAENFMSRLDTGVALCRHANNVRKAAEEYLVKRQARAKSMTRSMTSGLAGPILANLNVHYLPGAKSGTFFARDNVSNFITWCRKSLKIFECLLFETDDLIMRKNEKHVILCLLEVARRGAKFGMLAPMLVQMERQIDREIAADNRANGIQTTIDVTDKLIKTEDIYETDSEEEEDANEPVLFYGPQPQIITNDLKSLDEMVRDLVEKCTCPSQFPMVRVSEGKYRIGDTKVLIFVRILRSHVMVRVGGGWDTLAHYLDKHDPCRCRAAHRLAVGARLIPRTNNQTNGIELHKAQVIYERSPPAARKFMHHEVNMSSTPNSTAPSNNSFTSPGLLHIQTRSRSPTPQHKYLNQQSYQSLSENNSPVSSLNRRTMSPSPRRLSDIRKKQWELNSNNPVKLNGDTTNPNTIPTTTTTTTTTSNNINHQLQIENLAQQQQQQQQQQEINNLCSNLDNSAKLDNVSDNGSEISDEGYRSLGLQQINNNQKYELSFQQTCDELDNDGRLSQNNSSDLQVSPLENKNGINDIPNDIEPNQIHQDNKPDEPLTEEQEQQQCQNNKPNDEIKNHLTNSFEQLGVFITDDEITVDIASSTGLRKTGFSAKIYGESESFDKSNIEESPAVCNHSKSEEKLIPNHNKLDVTIATTTPTICSKIPRSPKTIRRRSIDTLGEKIKKTNSTEHLSGGFNRVVPEYRSVRINSPKGKSNLYNNSSSPCNSNNYNNWNGRNKKKNHPTLNEHPIRSSSLNSHFDDDTKQNKTTKVLYDSNGKRVSGKSTSLTTSPVKNKSAATSPLAQQLLKVASNAKNDAQMLERMKQLLQQYGQDFSTLTGATATSTAPVTTNTTTVMSNLVKNSNLKKDYNSYTSEWVHNNGDLERSSGSSSSSSTAAVTASNVRKSIELKRNNSTESRQQQQPVRNSSSASNVFIPKNRLEVRGGISKIPTPIRRNNTELY